MGSLHHKNNNTITYSLANQYLIGRNSRTERKLTMNTSILYILISVIGGAVGQVLLKKGMNDLGEVTLSIQNIIQMTWKMLTNPYVFIGLFIYFLSVIFWLAALSKVELSYAYPFASLSYIIMFLAGWLLLGESITPMRIVGTLVIGIGVFLISRS